MTNHIYFAWVGLFSARVVYREPDEPTKTYQLHALPGSYECLDDAHAVATHLNTLQLEPSDASKYVLLRTHYEDNNRLFIAFGFALAMTRLATAPLGLRSFLLNLRPFKFSSRGK